MSVLNENQLIGASGVSTAYTIDNSCRFNDDDSAYLSRTPGSAGNRKTWTWSGWVKRGNISEGYFFGVEGPDTNRRDRLGFTANSTILYGHRESPGWAMYAYTDAVFRDPSAWYHIVVAFDSTQATQADRLKIYVNGISQSITQSTSITLNEEGYVNNTYVHNINDNGNTSSYDGMDGYLAEVHFIDGQALDHTSFGETDAIYGHWKPKEVTGMTYGTNGFYLPFDNTGTIHAITTNGNAQHSTSQSKIGSSSIAFDGSGDYLSITDFTEVISGDFTTEFWVRPDSTTGNYIGLVRLTTSSTTERLQIAYHSGTVQVYGGGSGTWKNTGVTTSLTTWTHIALVRSGTTLKIYKDGVDSGWSVSSSGDIKANQHLQIGYHITYFDGCLDEIRISNTARYTSNFTPSTTAFEDDSNTLLLIHSDTTNGSTTFTDSSGVQGGLGNDSSGRNNNWTPTNLASTDQMLDTPTNNFCTLNPLVVASEVTFTEGNARFERTSNAFNWGSAICSMLIPKTGKWYFEMCHSGALDGAGIGIAHPDISTTQEWHDFWGWHSGPSGEEDYILYDSGYTAVTQQAAVDDIYQIAYDADNGKLWVGRNNAWGINDGTPVTPTDPNANFTGLSGDFVPAISVRGNGDGVANFGQDSSFAGNKTAQGNTDGNGYGDFYYEPPSGFLALCTANLDDPAAGLWSDGKNVNFNTVTYTGNGSTQTINTIISNDLTWLKMRNSGGNHYIWDNVRGFGDNAVKSDTNQAEGADSQYYTISKNSTGFDITQDYPGNEVNYSGNTYVAWNWKANGSGSSNDDGSITSTVSANTAAGFSIVSYTGIGTAGNIGHGLNQQTELVMIKNRDDAQDWMCYTDVIDNSIDFLKLNLTNAKTNSGVTPFSESTFYVGTNPNQGANGDNYIAYCFHSVDGYSKVGSYTGNGSTDGTFVYTSFTPKYVMIKRTDSADDWNCYDSARSDTGNPINETIYLNSSGVEAANDTGHNIDFSSNGFKLRTTNGQENASGGTYIYLAFAETPFKYSNAR